MRELLKKPIFYNFLAFLLLVVVITSIYVISRNTLYEKQTYILTLNRDLVTSEMNNEITKIETAVNGLEDYIIANPTLDGLETYFEEVLLDVEFASLVFFGGSDNVSRVIVPSLTLPPDWDITQRPWYISAVAQAELIFTDAYLDVSENKYVITAAKPVYIDGELFGVVGMDVDLSTLATYIQEGISEIGGYSFLLDSNDFLIAFKDQSFLQNDLVPASQYGIPTDSLVEDYGIISGVSVNEVSGSIAYAHVEHTNIIYGVFMSNIELNQSNVIFLSMGIILVSIFLMVFATVYFIFNYYVKRPLDFLIDDISQITREDGYQFRFSTEKGKGFIDARIELNKVLEDTNEYKNEAEKVLSELTFRNQKYNLLLDSATDIVFQMDHNLRYVEIYGKGLSTLKKNESDFIGKTYKEVFGESLNEKREQSIYMVMSGRKNVYSWEYVVDKEVIYFETSISPLFDLNENIIGVVGVTRDITEQEMRYQDMVSISNHDYLTGLKNRRVYIDRLNVLETMKDYPFGIVNMDVNGLKIINDAYGHSVGDQALQKTAEVLKQTCDPEHIVSRVSGDEFTIILPKSSEKETKRLKNNLLKAFEHVKIMNIELSVAIGYYIKKDGEKTIDEARMLAENDMYRHKISERKSVKNKAISAILKTLTEKFEEEKTHSKRVQEISVKIGEALDLDIQEIKDLSTAALFHDIGKISIPDEIIRKAGKLTDREFEIMKTHAEVGYEILRAADEYSELAVHASSHHEKWNGSGYPRGLKGEQIPFFSRIISIADAYEAMTADRPYRKALSDDYAVSEIIKYSGIQFDPILSRVFVEKVMGYPWPESKEE